MFKIILITLISLELTINVYAHSGRTISGTNCHTGSPSSSQPGYHCHDTTPSSSSGGGSSSSGSNSSSSSSSVDASVLGIGLLVIIGTVGIGIISNSSVCF